MIKKEKMMQEKKKLKILFLCAGNSCRSQMAEGWARHLKGNEIEPYSAGSVPEGLDANTVKVMAEADVDISRQKSKHINDLKGLEFDYVVTVCDESFESCPVYSGKAKAVHIGFDDPPILAKGAKTAEDVLNCFRKVRDEIRSFIEKIPEALRNLK